MSSSNSNSGELGDHPTPPGTPGAGAAAFELIATLLGSMTTEEKEQMARRLLAHATSSKNDYKPPTPTAHTPQPQPERMDARHVLSGNDPDNQSQHWFRPQTGVTRVQESAAPKLEQDYAGRNAAAHSATYGRPLFSEQMKIAGSVKKLSGRSNWFTWKIAFLFLINGVDGAIQHLEGTHHPDHYSYDLDMALGRLLIQTLDVDQLGQVALLMSQGEMRGSKIYQAIKAPFERSDPGTRDAIESTLSNMEQGSHSVGQLAQALRMLYATAVNAGMVIDEERKIYYLLKALNGKFDAFTGQLNALRRRGLVPTFDHAVEDCVAEESRLAVKSGNRDNNARAFSAALQGTALWSSGPSSSARGQGSQTQTPFEGECWYCQKPGHKKRQCKTRLAKEKKKGNETSPSN
ncbi:hypothetical protein OC846_006671 [Tilletia horrida]|uniref:CCHC-type domain-containing protein n=1 Tax=Tilletia horrida TaxID=155126 RepID=A0AAN6GJ12_9BASI|nr:hypothetical protein OC846_006671 [Tilletia horrida]KAK0559026.1 hypothetical protein OC861_006768 [Tilletia horrida]